MTPPASDAPTPLTPARFRWRPTREGVLWMAAAGLMLLAGLFKLINLLILIGDFMIAMLLINAWLARRSVYHIDVQRTRCEPVFANQPTNRLFTVTNTADRGASVSLIEQSVEHRSEVFVAVLAPDETRHVSAGIRPTRRGRFVTSPLSVVAGYPFGLINYTVTAAPADTLVVLPAVGRIDVGMLRRWLIRTGAGDNNARRVVRRQSTQSADVRGVRAYRPGDSPRDVHWRTTARRNELMVREYDSTEPLDLLLVVEPWLPETPTPADRQRLEAGLSLAAALFWAWCHGDDTPETTLVVAGVSSFRTGRGTEAFGRSAMTMLADAVGGPSQDVPSEAFRRRSNRCARLLVSSRPATPMVGHLRGLTGVPFVSVDPSMPLLWYTPPTT